MCSRSQTESESAVLLGRRQEGEAVTLRSILKRTSNVGCGRKLCPTPVPW